MNEFTSFYTLDGIYIASTEDPKKAPEGAKPITGAKYEKHLAAQTIVADNLGSEEPVLKR